MPLGWRQLALHVALLLAHRHAGGAGAGLVGAAGHAAAGHRAGRAVRALPRDLALHRLRQPPGQCRGRLAVRRAGAVQLALLPAVPHRASPLHPGPGARPGTGDAAADDAGRLPAARAVGALLALPHDHPVGRAARRPLRLSLYRGGRGAPRHPQHPRRGRRAAGRRAALGAGLRLGDAFPVLDPAAADRPSRCCGSICWPSTPAAPPTATG